MSPKEKAEELAANFMFMCHECDYLSKAKQCATLCVDEILRSNPNDPYPGGYYEEDRDRINYCIYYWEEVKKEIQKL